MTAAVETLAYAASGGVPWHGLGNAVSNKMTPKEMLKAASLDWTVSKRPVFFRDTKDAYVEVKDEYALVRDSDGQQLSMVGSKWKVHQNEATMDFFTKYVKAGKMEMETAGSLWNGRYVWGLARLGKDFKIGKTDEVRGYLLLASPHVFGKAMLLQTTAIRVVCWNTLTFAIGRNLKGDGTGFRVPHSQHFDERTKALAEMTLGMATEQMVEFQEVATMLSKKKATENKVNEYFCEVLKWDPKKATKKKDGEDKEPRMLPKFRAALTHAPGQQMPSAIGTWWGGLQAITHVIDHEVGRDRNTALRAAWVGGHADLKRSAVDLAMKYAQQSKAA